MNYREMFRQTTNDNQTPQHKLGNRTNRWANVQADARCPSCEKQFKQQRQQRRLKHDLRTFARKFSNIDFFSENFTIES